MKKNIIIVNGQLRYYKDTIDYWKEFSKINNCTFYFITQPFIKYKDDTLEYVDFKLIYNKLNITEDNIFLIDDDINSYIDSEINIIYENILSHNEIFNQDHNLDSYSKLAYVKRCLYRQLSTKYLLDKFKKFDEINKKFNRCLYTRIDFLIYKSDNINYYENGLYDYESPNIIYNNK